MRKANAWVGRYQSVFAYSIYQACPGSLVNTTTVRGSGEVKRESDGTYEVRAGHGDAALLSPPKDGDDVSHGQTSWRQRASTNCAASSE